MKPININKLVKPSVRRLAAYQAAEIPCRIKLDANESPFAYTEDLSKILKNIKTNRYPDSEAKELKGILSKSFGIKRENLLFGNGSDELIYYLIATFGGPVLYPVPTFSMYGIISQALGEDSIAVPLDAEFDLDLDKALKAIKKDKPKIMFLSSPNNPTGNCFSSDRILKIIDSSLSPQSPSLIVIDEAYQPFSSDKGFLPLLQDYKNLVIMRTLSKIGMAALRLGFMIADAEIINEVNKVRLPFNVNSFSQAIAAAILKDRRWLDSSIRNIATERERLLKEMGKMEGITTFPSEANFIFFKVKDADKTYNALLRKGILIRNMNSAIKGCLRVTIGTREENVFFLNALQDIYS